MHTYFPDYEQQTLDRIKDRESPQVTDTLVDALSYIAAVVNTLNSSSRSTYNPRNPLPYTAARAMQSALAHDFVDLFLLTNILPPTAVQWPNLRQAYNSLSFRSAYQDGVQSVADIADGETLPEDDDAQQYGAAVHPCNAFLGMRYLFNRPSTAPLIHEAMQQVSAADKEGCLVTGTSRTQLLLSLRKLPNSSYINTPHNFVTIRSPLFSIAAALSVTNSAALSSTLRYGRIAPGTYPAHERFPDEDVISVDLTSAQETKYPGLRRLKMAGARYISALPYYLTALLDLCRLAEQSLDPDGGATGCEQITVLADGFRDNNLIAFDSKQRGANPGARPAFTPL